MDTFYFLFGNPTRRLWDDALRYGFVSAGGGPRWSRPLRQLSAGDEVLVHVPPRAYVGHGRVLDSCQPIRDFTVEVEGTPVKLLDLPLVSPRLGKDADNDENCEWVARVEWIKAVPHDTGYWRPGLYSLRSTTVAAFPDDEQALEIKRNL